jgi:hypothetical protein
MNRLFAALLLLAPVAASAQPAPTWPGAAYNPAPLPDDLVLPLPCGGAMAFRRVDTPAGDSSLDDRPILLGSPDTESGYIEYLRRTWIAGPFGGGATPRHFFMSKYEVTRAQFEALRSPPCPAANTPASRQPAVEVTWLDAVDASQRYSTWLLRNAASRLPRRGSIPAFVRLPTETEWEYAVRGGAAVSEAEFQARTFPMSEGPEAYAWFQGPRSAAGRLSAIGLKRPNPLGLHDMLGNAAEWVLEPFRLNRVGRQHGLAGGLVARGGDFRNTGEAQLRSSLRIEYAPFEESGEPTRLTTVGFRFVLAGPAQASLADTAALRQAFDAETQARTRTQDDPAALIAALRRDQADPATQTALDRIGAAYARETRERTDRARVAARAQLQAAAVLSRSVFIAQQRASGLQNMVDNPAAFGATPQQARNWRPMLDAVRAEVEGGVRAYAAVVAQLAEATDVAIPAEVAVVQQELRAQNVPNLAPHVALVARHAETARRGGIPPLVTLRSDILGAATPPR